MTLGGIAAAIGLVIDDAIVVVEAIHTKRMSGLGRLDAIQKAIQEIIRPLVGSTLTPVVVFVPLAFLEGITGIFFRALALTMVVALLTSLVLAVTLTPSLAGVAHPLAQGREGRRGRRAGRADPAAGHRASTKPSSGPPCGGAAGRSPPVSSSWSWASSSPASWKANSCRPWTRADSSSTT